MNLKNGMKFLFIGNSATKVNNIPQTLQALAKKCGFTFDVEQITPDGCELAKHADISTDLGKRVFNEIAKGYDAVFLQENGSCMASDKKREACEDACRRLIAAARESGAEPYIYVRPPCFKDYYGYQTIEQCEQFDEIFGRIAKENGGVKCIYVNRAFAYVKKNMDYDLWGDDRAHTNLFGAYLIVCTFFATLFGVSATNLISDTIEASDARVLSEVADRIAFGREE